MNGRMKELENRLEGVRTNKEEINEMAQRKKQNR